MPRPGLRLKITLVFAAAMGLLLGALGLFVYVRYRADLDRSLNAGLRSRAEDVRALVMQADSGLSQAGSNSLVARGERYAQVVRLGGQVADETPLLARTSLLSRAELRRAFAGPMLLERNTTVGVAGRSRLLALPVRAQDQRLLVVVGASLRARDGALADLRTLLLLGGPVALVLASLVGYGATSLALRSVASMRRRARQISLQEPGQRLPVPRANDELAHLARTLNDMLARNEAAFERERTFVADASHELRSPLAILRAELDVALVGERSRGELETAVATAAEEANHLSALVEALLTLAAADRGSLQLRRESIDVGGTLERVRARFEERARRGDRAIVVRGPRALALRADPLRLEQALGNLLDNALRHGAGTVAVEAARRGTSVELTVSDEGPGFPPPFLPAAFERFTRAEKSRTAGGTGLGLSIVRSIARAHGGEAIADNAPAGGARVRLLIPDYVGLAAYERASSTSRRTPNPEAPLPT